MYQNDGPEALIASVPRRVFGSAAATAIPPPAALRRSGRLNGNQWRAAKRFAIEPPDFQL